METTPMKQTGRIICITGLVAVLLELLSTLIYVIFPYNSTSALWSNELVVKFMSMIYPVLIAAAAVLFFSMLLFGKDRDCSRVLKVCSVIAFVAAAYSLVYTATDSLLILNNSSVYRAFGEIFYNIRLFLTSLLWPSFIVGVLAEGMRRAR